MSFLHDYRKASGQIVNLRKSQFVVSERITQARMDKMKSTLGMSQAYLTIKYLGAQIHKGINRLKHRSGLLAYFDRKINHWVARHLSPASKLILIKHVLSSIPLYLLAASKLPKGVIRALNSKMAKFF